MSCLKTCACFEKSYRNYVLTILPKQVGYETDRVVLASTGILWDFYGKLAMYI